ncbi:MAG: hypothetical protein H0X72_09505 [Acidobacteria bacterium]|jgi:hypothetical protein|nr:hypothetical protein [Acidobacteriota bacterium]
MNLEIEKRDEVNESEIPELIVGRLNVGLSHTIPPIIINSSSFEFETVNSLVEEKSLLQTSPENLQTVLGSKVYKITGFGPAQSVRVFRYNEANGNITRTKNFPSPDGVKVGIWLQYYQNKKWEWVGNTEKDPEILIIGLTNDFTITTDKELLEEETNYHQTRTKKRKYPEGKIWRFGKVKVYDFVGGEYDTDEGHEYVLGFDNHHHS